MNTTRIGCLNKQQSRKMMAIDTRGATMESDDLWRMPMWHDMMAALPARVLLNLKKGTYCVRDNTLRIIYADDIQPQDADQLIREWAMCLNEPYKGEFENRFSMRWLVKVGSNEGMALYYEAESHEAGMISIAVEFGQGSDGKIMEFSFRKA